MLYDKNAVRMWNIKHYFVTYLQKKKKKEIEYIEMHFVYTQIHNICTPLLSKAQIIMIIFPEIAHLK